MKTLRWEFSPTSTAIAQSVASIVDNLRECEVVPRSVPFFIRIDQYEELCRLEDWGSDLGLHYRRVINKALGTRDPRVSYRVGTRRYAWRDDLLIYGTKSALERERDYQIV